MRAVFIEEYGGADGLAVRDVEEPGTPSADEVLVEVRAAALNRADILQRMGLYPPPMGFPERIPGLEFAGVVIETGDRVRSFKEGDRVFGITSGGAQAEFLISRESMLSRIPDALDIVNAAAVPEAFITAHDAVFVQGGLRKGESLLIHAVGSGVGLAALQLAKAAGAFVIGTSRTREKLERCFELGLDKAIETGADAAFETAVLEATDGSGADVILDLVGAPFFASNLACSAEKGRILLVGLVGGAVADFDLRTALTKRLTILGSVLRARNVGEKAEATAAFADEVLPLFRSGEIKPNVDKVFKAQEIVEAHEYLESNVSFGKVVLEF